MEKTATNARMEKAFSDLRSSKKHKPYAQKNNPVFVYSWQTKKQSRLRCTNGLLPLRGRLAI
jgi:hypothetical protein